MWKGAVTFGLVIVPVALHAATERRNGLSFRLLHAKDESLIDYKRFCEAEGVEVPWREIVKGYEVSKGQYVVVTDEDLPSGEALVLTTLRWAYEMRAATALRLPRATSHDRRELELALRLIDTLASDWDPRRYKDTYRDVLMDIIQRKAAGEEIRAAKVERAPKVRSLVRALEASLAERRPAKAADRR